MELVVIDPGLGERIGARSVGALLDSRAWPCAVGALEALEVGAVHGSAPVEVERMGKTRGLVVENWLA